MKSRKNMIIVITFILVALGAAVTFFSEYSNVSKKTIIKKLPKAKIHMFYTDENGEPLKGVEVQIINENFNVVDTIHTDAYGFGKSKDLIFGTYYYKQVTAPEGTVLDDTMYDFLLSKPNQVLEAFVECEIER